MYIDVNEIECTVMDNKNVLKEKFMRKMKRFMAFALSAAMMLTMQMPAVTAWAQDDSEAGVAELATDDYGNDYKFMFGTSTGNKADIPNNVSAYYKGEQTLYFCKRNQETYNWDVLASTGIEFVSSVQAAEPLKVGENKAYNGGVYRFDMAHASYALTTFSQYCKMTPPYAVRGRQETIRMYGRHIYKGCLQYIRFIYIMSGRMVTECGLRRKKFESSEMDHGLHNCTCGVRSCGRYHNVGGYGKQSPKCV